MKTIRATVALLVVAGALPAVQAQGIPSVEACIRYAEADAAFDAAMQPALAAYEAALPQASAAGDAAWRADADAAYRAAFEAALQPARARGSAPSVAAHEAAHEAAERQAYAVYEAAFEAAMQPAEAAFEVVKQQAEQALVTAYSAIYYDIDGGPRSDVQDVMEKLREHHRQRCRELHGL